jgi:hypothetical protein
VRTPTQSKSANELRDGRIAGYLDGVRVS